MKHLVSFVFVVGWIAGIVLAKGFWMTLFACIPIVGFGVTVAHLLRYWGLV